MTNADGGGAELWAGEKTTYRLVADHETSFQEAWAEMPPSLCHISYTPFDVDLTRIKTLTGEIKGTLKLSALPHTTARSVLGAILRDQLVVRDACGRLLDELETRRPTAPETAAIVFVGNDQEGDEEDNQHARQVATALKEIRPSLKVRIATSTTNQAQKEIEEFQKGKGDVLIVKQMGGVGLDVHRLKVCLDLSTVRTGQQFTQRVCRIATIWKLGPDPKDLVLTSTYIAPEDCITRDLFYQFIGREGGEATMTNAEYVEKVLEATQGQVELPDTFIASGVADPMQLADTRKETASGNALSSVVRLFSIFSELTRSRTYPEAANIMEKEGITFGEVSESSKSQTAIVEIHDIEAEQKAVRERVSQLAKKHDRQMAASG